MDHSSSSNVWRQWLEQNASRCLLYARQQTRCEADAEDILQEALVETWQRLGTLNLPVAMLLATIRRRAIDLGRSTDRRMRRELEHHAGETRWFTANDHDGAETDHELELAVKNLPEIYREVVTLKIWGELTFLEIAEILDVPPNTAASRYRYGLERLRESMKEVPR